MLPVSVSVSVSVSDPVSDPVSETDAVFSGGSADEREDVGSGKVGVALVYLLLSGGNWAVVLFVSWSWWLEDSLPDTESII